MIKIIQRGLNFHLTQPPLTRNGNRGRLKRRVGHNLLLRLDNFSSAEGAVDFARIRSVFSTSVIAIARQNRSWFSNVVIG